MTTTMLNNLNQRDLVLAGAFAGLSLVVVLKRYSSYKSTEPSVGGTKAIQQVEKSPLASQQREPGGTYPPAFSSACFRKQAMVKTPSWQLTYILEWNPMSFDYPTVAVCADEPGSIKPIPYRPFKWGEYQCVSPSLALDGWACNTSMCADYASLGKLNSVTMGIRSMPWDEWFEVSGLISCLTS